jgi:GNAT superfamily N-acetyltransferase
MTISIRPASPSDCALVFALVGELAEYERLAHEVDATEALMAAALFGPQPRVFCDIAEWTEPGSLPRAEGFALWFYSFSTFRGRHGIYLEDIFVRPRARGRGLGRALLVHLAQRCVAEGLARFEWSVLDWNAPSIAFYKTQGAELMQEWTRCRISGVALAALAGKGA